MSGTKEMLKKEILSVIATDEVAYFLLLVMMEAHFQMGQFVRVIMKTSVETVNRGLERIRDKEDADEGTQEIIREVSEYIHDRLLPAMGKAAEAKELTTERHGRFTQEIQVFNNQEFGAVRTLEINGEPWMVGKDVAQALGYVKPTDSVRKLVDQEDRGISKMETPSGAQEMTIINESGLYSLVLSSKLPGAKKFKRWVTSEVLPAIRKTGSYRVPRDFPAALRMLADSEEQRLALQAENEYQKQIIADLEPMKKYIDVILSSPGTMTTTQIAADYNMSAKKLNRILHEQGIQRNVNDQWILYAKHMGQGYTKSETISFTRSDGRQETKMQTKWTQKGRLMIHETLNKIGIHAVMDIQ